MLDALAPLARTIGASPEALAAALLASLLCAFVGTFVVLRRLVALGGGIAHAAFGGIGLALALGFDPRLGAAGVAVTAAAALAPQRRERIERQDAAIGVLWAVGMAVGMLLLARGPVSDVDVEGILFGDIASVRGADLVVLAALDLTVVVLFALAGRELTATAFDAEHARLRGLPVTAISFVFLLLVALAVVALLSLVGVVLGIALLAIPPLAALRLWRGLGAAIAGAGAIALVVSVGGLAIAARAGLPAGPTIVLLGAVVLGLAHLAPRPSSRDADR